MSRNSKIVAVAFDQAGEKHRVLPISHSTQFHDARDRLRGVMQHSFTNNTCLRPDIISSITRTFRMCTYDAGMNVCRVRIEFELVDFATQTTAIKHLYFSINTVKPGGPVAAEDTTVLEQLEHELRDLRRLYTNWVAL